MMNKGPHPHRFHEATLLSSAELSQINTLLAAEEAPDPAPAQVPKTDGPPPPIDLPSERCRAAVRPHSPDAFLLAIDATDLQIATELSLKELFMLRERGARAARSASFRSRK